MGNQTNTINNVEQIHGKVKNTENKGFFEAFVVGQGSDRLNFVEHFETQKLGLGEDEKDGAQRSTAVQVDLAIKAVKAVKKEGLTRNEPFLTQIISINYRKEQS
jgi:hypothetical protein